MLLLPRENSMERTIWKTRASTLRSGIAMAEFRRRAVFVTFLCLTATCGAFLIWQLKTILLLMFAGCLSALVFSTLISAIQRLTGLRRGIGFAIAIVLCGSALVLAVWGFGPALAQQLNELRSDLPAALKRILSSVRDTQWGRWLIAQWADPDQLSRGLSFIISRVGGAMATTASVFAGMIVIFLTTMYLSAEPQLYERGLRRLVPPAWRILFDSCLHSAVTNLRFWMLAKLVSMTTIGLLISVGLWIIGVPLAGTLGCIAAFLTFIPNLGPLLSVLPAALLAFALSPAKGLLTMALFMLAHFLEGNLVTPLAERAFVKLPPALTLSVQLVLGILTGPLGIALAAPVTAAMLGVASVLLPVQEKNSLNLDGTKASEAHSTSNRSCIPARK